MSKKIPVTTKVLFSIFSVLVVSFAYLSYATIAQAQIPGFKEPSCDTEENTDNPEFNSLRPYQTSGCGDSKKAYYCNNDYIIEEGVSTSFNEKKCSGGGGAWVCPTNGLVIKREYVIDGEGAELPIFGNTEEVVNSTNPTETIDDATKVNEYLSWYLEGTTDKAEYEGVNTKTLEGKNEIINYSGPLRKLLPGVIQDAARIKSIKNANETVKYLDENSVGTAVEEKVGPLNHNQIVVCADKQVFGINNPFVGTSAPYPCYENGSFATNEYRLKDWEEDLSIARGFSNTMVELLTKIPSVTDSLLDSVVSEAWNNRKPPLPWDEEFGGDYKLYLKAYQEWKGKSCIILPFLSVPLCVDNPLVSNEYADLFRYIPLGNTTDKGAKHIVTGMGTQTAGQTIAELEYGWSIERDPVLFYAHAEEVLDLTNLLNKIHIPSKSGQDGEKQTEASLPPDVEVDKCEVIDVRSNPGDNLFPSSKDGRDNDLHMGNVGINVQQIECLNSGDIDKYLAKRDTDCKNPNIPAKEKEDCDPPACKGVVYVEIRTAPKIPNIDQITDNTVTGPESTFRRIFPKTGEDAPVSCIADIEGKSKIKYEPKSPNTNLIRVDGPGGGSKPDNASIYFPKLGTIYEYFLKGIQTALRPKGYGEPIVNGTACDTATCGEWESKLKGSGGSCGICNASTNSGDEVGNLAKKILTAAGAAYNVPAANIWAAMKHEGADGYQGTTYDFSDENVRKWSNSESCGGEPMPGCDNNADSTQPPFGFIKSRFYTDTGNADDIWSSVQKIDPSRNSKEKVSRCNFLDAAFAAANLLAQASANTKAGTSCGSYSGFTSVRPGTCSTSFWKDEKVAQSHNGYAGYCVNGTAGQLYSIEDAVSWYKDASCE